jgi:hypothetical protein
MVVEACPREWIRKDLKVGKLFEGTWKWRTSFLRGPENGGSKL